HAVHDGLFVFTATANAFLLSSMGKRIAHHKLGGHRCADAFHRNPGSARRDGQAIFGAADPHFPPPVRQGLISLPVPEGMIWHDPVFPSRVVTYGTATDFFFSAHTATAVFGATEMARLRRTWLTALGIAVAVFEATAVIILRVHYTMDVFAGAITALWAAGTAGRLAPSLDRGLAQLAKSSSFRPAGRRGLAI